MTRPAGLALALAAAALCGVGVSAQEPAPEPIILATPQREGQRIDERRPETPFTVDAFGLPVQLTGSWEYTDERRRNFDLSFARDRDRRVREHELKLEARARPNATTEVFLQAVGFHETRHTQGTDGAQHSQSLERGQTWVRLERMAGSPWSLQLGRVALIDRRSWWWDDDLDALRLRYADPSWRLDTGLARELAPVSSEDNGIDPQAQGVVRWFGQATWRWAERHALDAFWLITADRSGQPAAGSSFVDGDATDPSDLDAGWLGLRASGEWRPAPGARLIYWADAALLRGNEDLTPFQAAGDASLVAGASTRRRVHGHAVDLGLTALLPWPGRPSVTVGYARGSGGARSATEDGNFRQTGLQENKQRLGGVKRWRIYGELLQPELSNLAVATLAGGVRVGSNSSLELVAHRYRQPVPSPVLVDARLSTAPLGLSGDIGSEIDLLIAVREWRKLELTLALSRFTPGEAFAANRRDPATAIELGVTLNF